LNVAEVNYIVFAQLQTHHVLKVIY